MTVDNSFETIYFDRRGILGWKLRAYLCSEKCNDTTFKNKWYIASKKFNYKKMLAHLESMSNRNILILWEINSLGMIRYFH